MENVRREMAKVRCEMANGRRRFRFTFAVSRFTSLVYTFLYALCHMRSALKINKSKSNSKYFLEIFTYFEVLEKSLKMRENNRKN
jgi:hypothetical protein